MSIHIVLGRRSPDSLHDEDTTTIEDDRGAYRQEDATGFTRLNALRLCMAAKLGRKH